MLIPGLNTGRKAVQASPENAQFQPNSNFQTFFFDITGDTDNRAGIQSVLAERGAWGGLFRVDLDASRNTGHISLVVLGDADHADSIILRFRTLRHCFGSRRPWRHVARSIEQTRFDLGL